MPVATSKKCLATTDAIFPSSCSHVLKYTDWLALLLMGSVKADHDIAVGHELEQWMPASKKLCTCAEGKILITH